MSVTNLAVEIDNLVAETKLIDGNLAKRLKNISEMIQGPQRGALAHVDFHALLDPQGIEERASLFYQKRPWWLAWLELGRNVLILAPIALTWFSLSQATTNYELAVRQDPTLTEEPFLLLWERGFDTLPSAQWSWLTFSHVALVDFLLLVALILMTIVIHLWRDVREDKAARRAAALRGRVEHVVWDLSKLLSTDVFNQDTTQAVLKVGQALSQFEVHAQELMNIMAGQAERLEKLEQHGQARLDKLSEFSTNLSQGATTLMSYGQDVRQVYTRLDSSVGRLAKEMEQVGQQQAGMVTSISQMSGSSAAAVDGLRETTKRLEAALFGLQNFTVSNTGNTKSITDAAHELGLLAQQLAASEQEMKTAIVQARNSNKSAADNLNTLAQSIGQIAAATNSVAARLDGMNGSLESLSRSNSEMAGALNGVLVRYDTVGAATDKAASDAKEMGKALKEALEILAYETKRLNSTVSSFDKGWATFLSNLQAQTGVVPQRPRRGLFWAGVGVAITTTIAVLIGVYLFVGPVWVFK